MYAEAPTLARPIRSRIASIRSVAGLRTRAAGIAPRSTGSHACHGWVGCASTVAASDRRRDSQAPHVVDPRTPLAARVHLRTRGSEIRIFPDAPTFARSSLSPSRILGSVQTSGWRGYRSRRVADEQPAAETISKPIGVATPTDLHTRRATNATTGACHAALWLRWRRRRRRRRYRARPARPRRRGRDVDIPWRLPVPRGEVADAPLRYRAGTAVAGPGHERHLVCYAAHGRARRSAGEVRRFIVMISCVR